MPLFKRALIALLLLLPSAVAMALPPQSARPSEATQRAFSASCKDAFHASNPDMNEAALTRLCECAGAETRSQGATDRAVRRETDAIRKDPKHPIGDRHVLDALHWCTIQAFHDVEAAQ